jgi:hypothetical protein
MRILSIDGNVVMGGTRLRAKSRHRDVVLVAGSC